MTRKFSRYNRDTGLVEEFEKPEIVKGVARWPLASQSAAVHPTQVGEAREFCRQAGVATEYAPSGEPIFTGPGHRRSFLKAWGMIDRDGFD